jgi:CheY-like chemotaxis protein
MAELRIFKSDSGKAGIRAFVAEDNAADVFWLEMVFKSARIPYMIELAQHGAAAQKYLKALTAESDQSPQIIFLDVHLPGATADEILDSLPDGFSIPLFILSGSEPSNAIRERVGEARCLNKPLTHEQLLDCLFSVGLLTEAELTA